MTIRQTFLSADIERYLLNNGCYNNDDLEFIFQSAWNFYEPNMQISKLQAQCLQFLLQIWGSKYVVEVGTFMGFSALSMAKVLPKEGKLLTIERDERFFNQACKNHQCLPQETRTQGALQNVRFCLGDAKEVLKTLEANASDIDVLFVDGDKKHYTHYLQWAAVHLQTGAYFLVDNIFFKGCLVAGEKRYTPSIRKLVENMKEQEQFRYMYLSLGDGMLVAQRL